MWRAQRILVVDDDAVVGRSINRVLSAEGYQVREALSGSEALEEMDHQEYDAVFTDIRMPGMDGLEMAARVQAAHPGVPVVVITGYGSEANETRARSLGVAAFLRKPLTPEMIVENAARALSERNETREAIRRSALALASTAAAPLAVAPTVAAEPAGAIEAAPARVSVGKNLALCFAAPFIGLAYFLAVPFIGFWAIGKYGWKAATRR